MPRGHGVSLYISREKGNHYYILTRHNILFPILESYSKKIFRKNAPKGPRKYLTVCAHPPPLPPGQSIILLKSNLFNMAAVSGKRSIRRLTLQT